MCGPPSCTPVIGNAQELLMVDGRSSPALGEATAPPASSQAAAYSGQPPGSGTALSSPQKQQDAASGIYQTNDFKMYAFKVLPCPRRYGHAWALCPFAHPGEKARRRDVRIYQYAGVACPDMKKYNACARGDSCAYSHNDFEYWLHPQRYRTQLCKEGGRCRRKTCFFAHHPTELRCPAPILPSGATLDLLAPPSTSSGGDGASLVIVSGDAAVNDQTQQASAAAAAAAASEVGLLVQPSLEGTGGTGVTAEGETAHGHPGDGSAGLLASAVAGGGSDEAGVAAAAVPAAVPGVDPSQQLGGMLSSLQLGGGPATDGQGQAPGGAVAALSNLDGELVLVHPDNAKLWQYLAEQQQAAGAARAARNNSGSSSQGNSSSSGGGYVGGGAPSFQRQQQLSGGGRGQGASRGDSRLGQQRQGAVPPLGLQQQYGQQQYGQQQQQQGVLLMPPQQQQQQVGGFVAPGPSPYAAPAGAGAGGLTYMAQPGPSAAAYQQQMPFQQQQQVVFSAAPPPTSLTAAAPGMYLPGAGAPQAQQRYSRQPVQQMQQYDQQQYMVATQGYNQAAGGLALPGVAPSEHPPRLLMAGEGAMRYIQVVNPGSNLGFDPAAATTTGMLMAAVQPGFAPHQHPGAGAVPPGAVQPQQQYMVQAPGSAPGLLVNPGQPMLMGAEGMVALAAAASAPLALQHQQHQPQQQWYTPAPGLAHPSQQQQQQQQVAPGNIAYGLYSAPQQVWGMPNLE